MLADGTITSLPLPNLSTVTRQQALDYFDNTWTITEVLFSALQGARAPERCVIMERSATSICRRGGSVLSTSIS